MTITSSDLGLGDALGLDALGLDVWRTLPAAQQPSWPDSAVLREVSATLS